MLEMGVREVPPGSNTSARIKEYLKGCVRGPTNTPVNMLASNWCSAFAGWCQAQALHPGEAPAHGWRIGVLEMEQDMRDPQGRFSGHWHPIEQVRSGLWLPTVGDLAIYDRSLPVSQDPKRETTWWRHVSRIVEYRLSGDFTTVGGNEQDQVRLSEANVDHPRLLGFGAYPAWKGPGASPSPTRVLLTDREKRELQAEVALSLDGIIRASVHGNGQ